MHLGTASRAGWVLPSLEVMLASWERSQEIFANELQVLRAEDAVGCRELQGLQFDNEVGTRTPI